eukprot:TRINITY_DN26665_c0_g1_i1.p1 TRINITY_DN26665_c0_g1~~TRINITY_DN26665_c0_g1_i1.p1  ORF type:complete len:142 (+),score=12.81 TRINITY_DN26665_c0_g1_i1:264-689(+)
MFGQFFLVGPKDCLLCHLNLSEDVQEDPKDPNAHLAHLVAHASLDLIDEVSASSSNPFIKVADRFKDWTVSAYIHSSIFTLVLLHNLRPDDSLKPFFQEVSDIVNRMAMNPFFSIEQPVENAAFENHVRLIARKWLTKRKQ